MLFHNPSIFTAKQRFYLVLGGLILAAWALLIIWGRSPFAELLSHEAIGHDSHSPLLRLALFLPGWFLMTVAMMLPGNLPLLTQLVPLGPARRGLRRSRLAALTVLGYLFPWAVFGLLAYVGDTFLHRLAGPEGPFAALSGLIAPAIVLVAGFYQLTPAKRRFMDRCRLAPSFARQAPNEKISGFTAGVTAWTTPVQQGLWLGMDCVGSCWSLMLLMFAVGHNRLDWMLALSGIMAAERLAPWGGRLARLVGIVLILWAVFWLLGAPQAVHTHP